MACQIQEIPENGADVAHLAAIHKDLAFLGGEPETWITRLWALFSWHEWHVSWRGGNEKEAENGDYELQGRYGRFFPHFHGEEFSILCRLFSPILRQPSTKWQMENS